MGILINGIGVGFFSAFFLSMYAEALFHYTLPFVLIYGMIGPFITAIAIGIQLLIKKAKHDEVEGYEETDTIRAARR
jgi:hypothetical protein